VTLLSAPLLRRPLRVRSRSGLGTATVSVVIPCYNYARYLPACVDSAASQQGVEVEIIIVDDASTDDSVEVATRMAATRNNVQVIRHDHNSGPVDTFNDGARRATGEFLVRLDADDLLTPGSLQRAVAVAQHFPDVGLVYGHPLHFTDGAALPEPRLAAGNWTIWPGRQWLADRCRQGTNVITSPEVLMRRSVVEHVGYQAPLRHSHDMEHWLRIAGFSDVAYIHGADQAWHREHDQSLSAVGVDSGVEMEERLQAFETLFRGPVGELPEAEQLSRTARSALAGAALTAAGHAVDAGPTSGQSHRAFLQRAVALDPTLAESRRVRRITRRAARTESGPVARLGALSRRAAFGFRSRAQWRRWHRNGVF
jgi:hypothetical protein